MKYKLLSLLLLAISSLLNPVYADNNLVIEDAWIAEAPPVSKVMVAYMTIRNPGPAAVEIIRADSDMYSSIEFHETVHEDGMARMVRYDSLNISANGKLELKRGGPHLMLFNPVKTLKAGDSVNITLQTKDNMTILVSIPVRKAQY